MRSVRVLVVDDSAWNRRILCEMLSGFAGVEVVGNAADGEQALRMAAELAPDLITLDLEMPRMDGFTFLRLQMASRPTAVVVISSHSARDNVFRALELGALDFITKPDPSSDSAPSAVGEAEPLDAQLARVIHLVRHRPPPMVSQRAPGGQTKEATATTAAQELIAGMPTPVLAIAASTGGPSALMELFAALPASGAGAIVIAQHMPERFTRTFAERLDKQSSFRVREAEHSLELSPHTALLCPGGRCLELERRGERLVAKVTNRSSTDRYAPSADRLFSSVARAVGERSVGVVLTGMGDDAAKGVVEIKQAGGHVLCESEATAVVYGMPRVAAETGCVDELLPLGDIVARVRQLVSS